MDAENTMLPGGPKMVTFEPAYEVYLREERRLPTQVERKRALERETGRDPYMIQQPKDKSFPGTVQRHSRGIWTEDTRKQLEKSFRDSAKLKPQERTKALEKLWRDNNMAWLRTSFASLKKAVMRAQDRREPVTPEVDKRVSKKFPGTARFLELLGQDRVINRGNAHMDLRTLHPNGEELSGWTALTPGVMIQFLNSGKLEEGGRNKFTDFGARVMIPDKGRVEVDRIEITKKSSQPVIWAGLVTKAKPLFEAEIGQVGATRETSGRFDFVTGGGEPFRRTGPGRSGFSVVYGVRRSNFHEQFHFFEEPALQLRVGGRWTFRILRLARDKEKPAATWLAKRADDPRPFIFRNDFETEAEQAEKEKTDLFWNHDAVSALEKLGYFEAHKITDALDEWKESPRGKPPPRKGKVRFRPKAGLPAPEIIGD